MRDNPLHERVFGSDAASLDPLLRAGFARVLRQQRDSGRVLGAYQSGQLMAVVGMFGPGHCLPNLRDKLALLPPLVRARALRSLPRIRTWLRIWSRHDPAFDHWHLGPAAVTRPRQGQGIGTELLAAACRELDSQPVCGYLETDKEANVGLYRRFGFRVVASENILGVTSWFMLRHPVGTTER